MNLNNKQGNLLWTTDAALTKKYTEKLYKVIYTLVKDYNFLIKIPT